MFKGIISLFTSGVIFHPMVLSGIILASVAAVFLDYEQLFALFANPNIYLLMLFSAFGYVYFFKLVYKEGGRKVDWSATSLLVVGNAFRFLISAFSMACLILMLFF